MDALRDRGKEKGVATILVVGALLFFILFFFVLAIDFAYVYTARGQLQNAADAAALAGADLIESYRPASAQTAARNEAKKFAQENYVTGKEVVLENSDIEFGFWDGTDFIPDPSLQPINAIKVTAKRIAARDNAVKLFFGSLVGWPTMDIERIAIASRPARAEVPIALCQKACVQDPAVINTTTGTQFIWTQSYQTIESFALSSFDPKNTSAPDVVAFFCGKVFDTCFVNIDTTQGLPESVFRQMRCAFLNPLYDSEHKTCVIDANLNNIAEANETSVPCTTIGSNVIVSSWSPLVPLLDPTECTTPSYQPDAGYDIVGYARAKIVDVYPQTQPSSGQGSINCACNNLTNSGYSYVDPPRFYGWENFPDLTVRALIINGIHCVDCNDEGIYDFLGKKASLVR